jgi:hypothetical protein
MCLSDPCWLPQKQPSSVASLAGTERWIAELAEPLLTLLPPTDEVVVLHESRRRGDVRLRGASARRERQRDDQSREPWAGHTGGAGRSSRHLRISCVGVDPAAAI